ncbi:MAG: hypothetical protein MZV65_05450 [Chromatiales bacterium]|nr:hypothetical protein [Chromatiales bacterium]
MMTESAGFGKGSPSIPSTSGDPPPKTLGDSRPANIGHHPRLDAISNRTDNADGQHIAGRVQPLPA